MSPAAKAEAYGYVEALIELLVTSPRHVERAREAAKAYSSRRRRDSRHRDSGVTIAKQAT